RQALNACVQLPGKCMRILVAHRLTKVEIQLLLVQQQDVLRKTTEKVEGQERCPVCTFLHDKLAWRPFGLRHRFDPSRSAPLSHPYLIRPAAPPTHVPFRAVVRGRMSVSFARDIATTR